MSTALETVLWVVNLVVNGAAVLWPLISGK